MIFPYGSRLYIAGKMRGCTLMNIQKFFHAAEVLEHSGYEVMNPAAYDCERSVREQRPLFSADWDTCMEYDLEKIAEGAEAMWMIYGWEHSDGARLEHEQAVELCIPIFYAPEFVDGKIVLEIP